MPTPDRQTGTAGGTGAGGVPDAVRITLNVTTSTNDEAARWAEKNPGRRAVISASEQTAGRGRLGRVWSSPKGGAWLTVVWPMPDFGTGAVTLAAASAACDVIDDTLRPTGTPPTAIRWPNDLLISGRKCGGMLGETIDTPGGRVLLLGVGINLNNTITGPMRTPAVSLAEHAGGAIDLPGFIDRLSAGLVGALQDHDRRGFSAELRSRVTGRLWGLGERVELIGACGEQPASGVLLGIDPRGGLEVEVDGRRRVYVSGEISCRGPGRPARPAEPTREDGVR